MTIRVRRDSGLYGWERALGRAGLAPVAGADEAGRGACAGPLVAAACILGEGRTIEGLRDSKLMTARARDACYDAIIASAKAYAVVVVPADEVDAQGVHRANLAALRRAVLRLAVTPRYVLTDGFQVDGMGAPSLAIWKGDRVAGCVAAASVLAKVTRDRMMIEADAHFPGYGFAVHKGYTTRVHQEALERLGPSPIHRMSYRNVREAADLAHGAERRARVIDDE
ncbi:ribonuclease HII [Propioniferax innocua]|uniref:Ribonuclease HII n=1 Tax=Propioniferax innocua TaxID=1753 RepID=A0A542ZPU7_9ACTN|nr:RNase HII [Propioniferax innocua]